MTIKSISPAALLLMLAACDTGPYDPAAHHFADTATGSHLSGVDTGVDPDGAIANNPSIRSNGAGPASYGGH